MTDSLVAAIGADDIDWNERERIARRRWSEASGEPQNLFLGGDILRPYLAVVDQAGAYLSWSSDLPLPPPPVVKRALQTSEEAVRTQDTVIRGQRYTAFAFAEASSLRLRSDLPTVAIASLTNTRRYGGSRFPLNIARLGQWLRFTHAARVNLFDASLDFDGDIAALGSAIAEVRPGLVGVSANFGELDRIRHLAGILAEQVTPPILVVGNVLAAWAPDELRRACVGIKTVLVPSYGEQPLEALCRLSPRSVEDAAVPLRGGPPPQVVCPDERLLAMTLRAEGQLAIETSFGCQYGACTFCPRDHRGGGWDQGQPEEVAAVIASMGKTAQRLRPGVTSVLSFVDEEAFGSSGRDSGVRAPILDFVETAERAGLSSEIYTRLEQIYDRRQSLDWNAARLGELRALREQLVRIFVGVESGSDSQLKRYAKGQDVTRVVDALRAGSLAGLPFEFGFITFDPLLTDSELVENVGFLARRDVVLSQRDDLTAEEIVGLIADSQTLPYRGAPVYESVAYMATELELLATSTYLTLLRRRASEVVGAYDPNFARWSYRFVDPRIGDVAAHCRVWTEGTFRPIYRVRLAVRSSSGDTSLREVVRRQRAATYSLLVSLTGRFVGADSSIAAAADGLVSDAVPQVDDPEDVASYQGLWRWVTEPIQSDAEDIDVRFEPRMLMRRRDS